MRVAQADVARAPRGAREVRASPRADSPTDGWIDASTARPTGSQIDSQTDSQPDTSQTDRHTDTPAARRPIVPRPAASVPGALCPASDASTASSIGSWQLSLGLAQSARPAYPAHLLPTGHRAAARAMPPELALPPGATPADMAYANARARSPRIGSLIPSPLPTSPLFTPDEESASDWSVLVQRDDVNVAGFAARKFERHQRLWREYQARRAAPPPVPPPPLPAAVRSPAGPSPAPIPPTSARLHSSSLSAAAAATTYDEPSSAPLSFDIPHLPNPFGPASPTSPIVSSSDPAASLATCADCGAKMQLHELEGHVCITFNPRSSSSISKSSTGLAPAPDPSATFFSRSSSSPNPLWPSVDPQASSVLSQMRPTPHMQVPPHEDIVALRKQRIAEQRAAARSTSSASSASDDEEEGITFGLGLPPMDNPEHLSARPLRRGTEPSALSPILSTGRTRSATAPLGPIRTTADNLCSECEAPLGARRITHLGRNWCKDCYVRHFLPRCPSCTEPVESQGVRSRDPSLEGVYHRACFVCSHQGCVAPLVAGGEHYAFHSKPYCARHYHEEAGTLCRICDQGVEGAARVSGGTVYHQSCLACQFTPELIGQRGHNKRCSAVRRDPSSCVRSHTTANACQPLDTFYQVGEQRLCETHYHLVAAHPSQAAVKAEKRISVLRSLRY